MVKNHRSELLIPGGSYNRIKTAFMYGADVVYAGTPDMSLRVKAKVTLEEMSECIAYAHSIGKKIYLAVNLYTHNKDIAKLPNFATTLKKLSPDGVIIADAGVFRYMHNVIPEIPLHVSTQANVCSYETAMFWYDLGAKLCVLGREVSFDELKEIRAKVAPDLRLETFIHGSMCMSYSGRCLLSNFLAERSSNQGNCAHCCRWNYKLYLKPNEEMLETGNFDEVAKNLGIEITPETRQLFDWYMEEEERKGEFMELVEDERGSYIMNSRDLCLMPKLNKLLEIGIDSLKVEGRNKSEYYAGITARAYSHAINTYYKDPEHWNYVPFMNELNTLQNRGYTYGFFDGHLTHHAMNYETTRSDGNFRYAACVSNHTADGIVLEMKNSISKGDILELLSPTRFEPIKITINTIIDTRNNTKIEKASVANKYILIPYEDFIGYTKDEIMTLLPIHSLTRVKIR